MKIWLENNQNGKNTYSNEVLMKFFILYEQCYQTISKTYTTVKK